jgi:hypothetical protein
MQKALNLSSSTEIILKATVRNLALSDSKLSCLDTQHASTVTRKVGITDPEICFIVVCL